MNPQIVTDCDSFLPAIAPLKVHLPTQADIFGPMSRLLEGEKGRLQPIVHDTWVTSYAYQGVVCVLFLLLCYLLYSYRSSLLELVRMVVFRTSFENGEGERNLLFSRFLNATTALGILFVGAVGVRLADLWNLEEWLPVELDRRGVEVVVIGALLLPCLVILYRYLATQLVGAVTQNRAFFRDYRFLSRLCGAVSFFTLTPLFLFFALGEDVKYHGIIYLTIIVLCLLYLFYLVKSFRFFVGRDVSILQWILYLCTVDLFPISFLLFAAIRFG